MTLDELIREGTARLAASGVSSPQVDAEWLAADLLALDRGGLVLHAREPMTEAAVASYRSNLDRRAAREPLQHILGRAPFRHLMLAVGPGVFIPRPETELLVDAVAAAGMPDPVALDLCSGSGALAISLATELGARVTAVEVDDRARGYLERNVAEHAPGIEVMAADVTDPAALADRAGAVDVVVCNPPYVPEDTGVEPEVRADPHHAVFAGHDGLDVIRQVAPLAARLLRPGGLLVMEHDEAHAQLVPALLAADARWRDVADHPDLAGRPRYVVATRR